MQLKILHILFSKKYSGLKIKLYINEIKQCGHSKYMIVHSECDKDTTLYARLSHIYSYIYEHKPMSQPYNN